ncbi:hypothetical protein GCM10028817_17460 [Spirosoma pomorum]
MLPLLVLAGCVDPIDQTLPGNLNVIAVDGTISNLDETQFILLSKSESDPISGRPASFPLTKARVEVVVDSSQVIAATETTDGRYQLPSDFKGQIGHAYQLRFTLTNGTRYVSDQQVMPKVPPIERVRAQFNPTSLAPIEVGGFLAAHDIYLDAQDPSDQTNFYRWTWRLWEKQDWCRTCNNGVYSINNVRLLTSANGLRYFALGDSLLEDCFTQPASIPIVRPWTYDYNCRSTCWAIIPSYKLNVFSDTYTNGGPILAKRVAQIPFYQTNPCLVEIRQAGLTASAYEFYKQLQDQTENTGGIVDTPPTASVGNVKNVNNDREIIFGVFTASAIATTRYWIDRKDSQGIPPGLFRGLNGREFIAEPTFPARPAIVIQGANQPYTAVCSSNEARTPFKPAGWRD